jgi:hypothetical protein
MCTEAVNAQKSRNMEMRECHHADHDMGARMWYIYNEEYVCEYICIYIYMYLIHIYIKIHIHICIYINIYILN